MKETLTNLPDGYRLAVDVYRREYDCTNGGVTSNENTFRLVADDYRPNVPFQNGLPALYLRVGATGAVHAYPADIPEEEKGFTSWQFGGNFIYSSDGRFPSQYPIPVHDRREK